MRTGAPQEYAGIVHRAVAFIIDSIIVFIPILILSIIFAIIAGLAAWAFVVPFSVAYGPFQVLVSLFSLLIGFFYFYILEHRQGQTYGKRVMDIYAVRDNGRALNKKSAALRSLFRMIYYLPSWGFVFLLVDFILIIVTDKKQRLGDFVAHTVVVKKKAAPDVVEY